MYKKVLYNIKKFEKNVGGGGRGGAIFEPKHSLCIKKAKRTKKSKKIKMTEPGLEPTTSGLEKPALLSTRLNTIIGNYKI